MKTLLPIILSVILSIVTFPVLSDATSELFLEIDISQSRSIENENAAILADRLYFAKKYRVVTINNKLVQDINSQTSFNLFQNEILEFVDQKMERIDGSTFLWKGRFKIPVEGNMAPLSQEKISFIKDITSTNFLIKYKDGKPSEHGPMDSEPRFETKPTTRILTVFGKITSPKTHKTYEIFSLESNPKFHVIMEIDKEKKIINHPDRFEKRSKEYKKHLDTIKDDKGV